jgi:hypothetical protein
MVIRVRRASDAGNVRAVPTWVPTSEYAAIELENLALRPRAEHGAPGRESPDDGQTSQPLPVAAGRSRARAYRPVLLGGLLDAGAGIVREIARQEGRHGASLPRPYLCRPRWDISFRYGQHNPDKSVVPEAGRGREAAALQPADRLCPHRRRHDSRRQARRARSAARSAPRARAPAIRRENFVSKIGSNNPPPLVTPPKPPPKPLRP